MMKIKGGGNKAFLGVQVGSEKEVELENGEETVKESENGAPIMDVYDDSAAAEAGLQKGDVITKIDDNEVKIALTVTESQ